MDNLFCERVLLHTKIYGVKFSPCKGFLAAATNFGTLAVFKTAVDQNSQGGDSIAENIQLPVISHQLGDAIHCLASTDDLLLCGTSDGIEAWRWQELNSKNAKQCWKIPLTTTNPVSGAHANSIAVHESEGGGVMCAGCEDSNIYVYDMAEGRSVRTLNGHTDAVHDVCVRKNGRDVISASEDGTVRIWDLRLGSEVHRIEPHKHEDCARPGVGKWLSAVDVDQGGDWMVCGGGPNLALWHLPSLKPTNVFSAGDTAHYRARLVADSVYACGSGSSLLRWSLGGDLTGQLTSGAPALFSFDVSDTQLDSDTLVACAGASPEVSLASGVGYSLALLRLA